MSPSRSSRILIGWFAVLAVVSALLFSPGCSSRVERQEIDGVDCVVVKSPIGQPRHVDCNWPAEREPSGDGGPSEDQPSN